jgi:hypothetical protein
MAVRVLSLERNKERAWRRAPRIRGNPLNPYRRRRTAQGSADSLCDSIQLIWDQRSSISPGLVGIITLGSNA